MQFYYTHQVVVLATQLAANIVLYTPLHDGVSKGPMLASGNVLQPFESAQGDLILRLRATCTNAWADSHVFSRPPVAGGLAQRGQQPNSSRSGRDGACDQHAGFLLTVVIVDGALSSVWNYPGVAELSSLQLLTRQNWLIRVKIYSTHRRPGAMLVWSDLSVMPGGVA
jgi:hypothetical protein